MSTTHTPGPWSVNDWPQWGDAIRIGAAGTPLIADVRLRDVSINEQKANASLIAAAPDLKRLLDEFVTMMEPALGSDSATGWIELVQESKSVIARAEGGT